MVNKAYIDESCNRKYQKNFFNNYVFPYIKNNFSILNLGSGTNFILEEQIKSHFKNIFITDIDIIKCNKPTFVDEYKVHDLEKILILNRKYDLILSNEVIEHLDNTDNLLKSCYQNLNNNGTLILTFPNLSSIFCRLELS